MNPADEIDAARLRRRVLYALIAFWAIVFQCLFPPSPRLVWNASASAPVGLWWVRPGARIAHGDMVVAHLPAAFRKLAATRHYLPGNVPLVKRVAAIAGDRVCAAGPLVAAGGRVVARLRADPSGREMPWWEGCRILTRGEFLLLMADRPDSFDGRYFGITARADIIGKATPLWTH